MDRKPRCLTVQAALLPVSSANATRGHQLFDIAPPLHDADDSYDRGVDSEEDPVGSHDQLPEISEPDSLQLGHDAAALREPRQRGDPRKDTRADLRSPVATRFDGQVVEDTFEIVDRDRRPAKPAARRHLSTLRSFVGGAGWHALHRSRAVG